MNSSFNRRKQSGVSFSGLSVCITANTSGRGYSAHEVVSGRTLKPVCANVGSNGLFGAAKQVSW